MQSFTFRLTTAGKLLDLIKGHFHTEERKEWHNLAAGPLCPHCNKGILVERMGADSAIDEVYYWNQCNNCGWAD